MFVGLQYRTWHNGWCGPSRQHTGPSGGHGLLCWRLHWIVWNPNKPKISYFCHRVWLWWEPDRCTVGSTYAWSGWQKNKRREIWVSLLGQECKKNKNSFMSWHQISHLLSFSGGLHILDIFSDERRELRSPGRVDGWTGKWLQQPVLQGPQQES